MAVLIDTSNLIISNISVMWTNRKNTDYLNMLRNTYTPAELKNGTKVIKDTLRSMLVASFGKYVKKFSKGRGKIFVCMDDRTKNYWRKFPAMGGFVEYKGNRKHHKSDDPVPYDKLIPMAHEIMDELALIFPYTFVLVKYAEGDDIIAVLTKHFKSLNEEVIVVSEDKDMVQLQADGGGVLQYRPIADKDHNFTIAEAQAQIMELLLRGDKGDGVANVRSPVDVYVKLDANGKQLLRSPAISAKLVELAIKYNDGERAIAEVLPEAEHEFALKRFEQNKNWILLLDKTPKTIADEILSYVPKLPIGENAKLIAYLASHKQCAHHAKNSDIFTVVENISPFAARKNKAVASSAALDDSFFDDL